MFCVAARFIPIYLMLDRRISYLLYACSAACADNSVAEAMSSKSRFWLLLQCQVIRSGVGNVDFFRGKASVFFTP